MRVTTALSHFIDCRDTLLGSPPLIIAMCRFFTKIQADVPVIHGPEQPREGSQKEVMAQHGAATCNNTWHSVFNPSFKMILSSSSLLCLTTACFSVDEWYCGSNVKSSALSLPPVTTFAIWIPSSRDRTPAVLPTRKTYKEQETHV